ITFTNVCNNFYIKGNAFAQVSINESEDQNIVEKGDLLFLMSSENQEEVGKSAALIEDFGELYLNSFCRGFRITVPDIGTSFLNYLLHSNELNQLISIEGRGFTRINLRADSLTSLPILIPSLHEQITIATYLDHKTAQIDALISKKEKLIELLNEERTALINQAVTKGLNPDAPMKDSGIEWIGEVPEHWKMSKLKHLSSIISKGTTPSTIGKDLIEEGKIKFIKAENIFENIIRDHPSFFIDEETNELLKRSNLCEKDVLFVIAGATIGKVAILPKSFLPANTNQAVCFIRLKDTSRSMFLWLWLQSNYIREIIKLQSNQAAQPNISMEDIANFNIPIMDDNELQQIVSFIERHCSNLDSMISRVSMQIDLLKEYRTALISEVVTGKVDVRDEKVF
ncbi:MAG TPA: restriction endonuclease subunit S, partial [Bacteroidales bacterium]|nr:restriction endonuclease subunit S [Bacteroidales bacterium]